MAKSAIHLAISFEFIGELYPGNASLSIGVFTEPKAKQFTLIFESFNSSAKHSVRTARAPLVALYMLSPLNF